MTVWLSDCPAQMPRYAPGVDFQRLTAVSGTQASFPALAGLFPSHDHRWISNVPAAFAGNGDWVVVVIDHASRSQFETITEAARAGSDLPPRLACLALTGKKFRGQRQRSWTALPGNMHLTVRFTVDLDAAKDQAALNMIPSIATADAIHHLSEGRILPLIKWVNDVWVDGGKVSGALTSASIKAGRISGVTFGVGLNIDVAPAIPPTPFVPRAACLAGTDSRMRERLPAFFETITRLLRVAIDDLVAGRRDEIFRRYRSRAGFIGKMVRIWPDDAEGDWPSLAPLHAGKVQDLNPDLTLQLEGMPHPVRNGRLAYEEHCRLLEIGRDSNP